VKTNISGHKNVVHRFAHEVGLKAPFEAPREFRIPDNGDMPRKMAEDPNFRTSTSTSHPSFPRRGIFQIRVGRT
jgi:hypothetical protein